MKKLMIIAIGLMMTLTSCANSEGKEATQTQVEKLEQSETTKEAKYVVTEVGAFDGGLFANYGNITVFTVAEDKTLYGALDSDGNIIIEPTYDYLSYGDGLLTDAYALEDGTIHYSYLNLDETVAIETVDGAKITVAQDFENGYALVTLADEIGADRHFGDYSCVIDKTGKVVVKASSKDTKVVINEDDLIVESTEDGKIVNIYNLDGTKASEDVYNKENYNNDNIYEIDGIYIIKDTADTKNESYAIYDNVNKKAITDYIYLYYGPSKVGNNYLVHKVSEVENEYNYVIIDNKGNEVFQVSENYKDFYYPEIHGDDLILTLTNGGVIVLNENGTVHKELDYEMVYGLIKSDFLICRKEEKIGVLDADYNEVVEPIYDNFGAIYDNKGLLTKDGMLYKLEIR